MSRPPSGAQAHAATALTEPALAVGLRLTKRDAGALHYRPRVQFPFLIMLWHNLNRERMTVRFEPNPGGETGVTITGVTTRANHQLVADPEHWAEPLAATVAG
jgi:hypothetical protein